jgi:hypothetical protein
VNKIEVSPTQTEVNTSEAIKQSRQIHISNSATFHNNKSAWRVPVYLGMIQHSKLENLAQPRGWISAAGFVRACTHKVAKLLGRSVVDS